MSERTPLPPPLLLCGRIFLPSSSRPSLFRPFRARLPLSLPSSTKDRNVRGGGGGDQTLNRTNQHNSIAVYGRPSPGRSRVLINRFFPLTDPPGNPYNTREIARENTRFSRTLVFTIQLDTELKKWGRPVRKEDKWTFFVKKSA